MPNTAEGPRATCPACQGHRIHKMTWSVKSQKSDSHFDGPVTWECMTCGHVWRLAASGDAPPTLGR